MDATWVLESGTLRFSGDSTGEREPMPLNTRVKLAAFQDKWIFLWQAPYRDASLASINRTLVTQVLYLAVADGNLHPVTEKPLYLVKNDTNPDFDSFIFPTDHGASVIYKISNKSFENNETVCADLNVQEATQIREGTCRFSGVILKNGDYTSDWAVKHFNGRTYALVRRNGIALMRSGSDGREEEFLQIPGTGEIADGAVGDFYIDETGVSVIWGRISDPSRSDDLRYARWTAATGRWSVASLATGDSRYLNMKFHRNNAGLFAFLQIGTKVIRQQFDATTGALGARTDIIDLAKYRTHDELKRGQAHTDSACTTDECLIHFVAGPSASFVYSDRTGLHRYGKLLSQIQCNEVQCLEVWDTANVALFRLER
jgi:hypothetical protein